MMARKTFCLILMGLLAIPAFFIGNGEGSEFRMRTPVTWANGSFIGENAGDQSFRTSFAGDVNGDGYDDILIGAPYNDDGGTDAGQVYLILGKASGWIMDLDLSSASASFWGEDAGDYAGLSLSGAGDINGDGLDDFLIGASGDDDAANGAGQAYLIFGKTSGWAMDTDLSASSASFLGEGIADNAAEELSGVGDVNDDGYSDFIIGAKLNDEGGSMAGQTYLILGKRTGWAMDTPLSSSSASFWGEDASDLSSDSLSGAGDVNGDGLDDFLIGADGNAHAGTFAGQTYLILGKASGWAMDTDLSSSSASFWGENIDDQSGYDVAGSGDVNSDGYDDFIIAANGNDDGGSASGKIYLILGRSSGWSMDTDLSTADLSFIGEEPMDALSGGSIIGDTNGDGYDDIMLHSVSNDYRGSNSGQTYLILGSGSTIGTDLGLASGSFTGEKSGDGLLVSKRSGDVDGNGLSDILIGSFGNDEGGSNAGQVYLFLSSIGPPGPRDLVTSNAADSAQVTLSWTAPSTWAEPLDCYRIYRSLDGSDYDYLGFTKTTIRTFTDSSVAVGMTYHYKIVADYAQGDNYLGDAKVSILCDIDTDKDGIGNIADWDDDDDKIADHSDSFPLDDKEWLDTDLDGNGNVADNDDDNDGIADFGDDEPLNPVNGIVLDIAALSSDLDGARFEIEGFFETMNSELRTINDTILERIDELDLKVSGLLYQLGAVISSVNASIQNRFDRIDSALATFKSEMQSDLDELSKSMDGDQVEMLEKIAEIREGISSLSVSLEGVNETILNEIDHGLGDLSEDLGSSEDNLSARILEMRSRMTLFRNDTKAEIGNVSALMAKMDELQALSSTADRIEDDLDKLNSLQTDVGDIQKEQEDASSGLSTNTILLIAALVMQLILIAIGLKLLLRRGRRNDGME